MLNTSEVSFCESDKENGSGGERCEAGGGGYLSRGAFLGHPLADERVQALKLLIGRFPLKTDSYTTQSAAVFTYTSMPNGQIIKIIPFVFRMRRQELL